MVLMMLAYKARVREHHQHNRGSIWGSGRYKETIEPYQTAFFVEPSHGLEHRPHNWDSVLGVRRAEGQAHVAGANNSECPVLDGRTACSTCV